jgi:hypothetical protein
MANGNPPLTEMFQQMWENLFKIIAMRRAMQQQQTEQEQLQRQWESLREAARAHDIDLLQSAIRYYGPAAFSVPGIKEIAQKYNLAGLGQLPIQTPEMRAYPEMLKRQQAYEIASGTYAYADSGKLVPKEKIIEAANTYYQTGKMPDWWQNVVEITPEYSAKFLSTKFLPEEQKKNIRLQIYNQFSKYYKLDPKTGEIKGLTLRELDDIANMVMQGKDPSEKYPNLIPAYGASGMEIPLLGSLYQETPQEKLDLISTNEGQLILNLFIKKPKLEPDKAIEDLKKKQDELAKSGYDVYKMFTLLNWIKANPAEFDSLLNSFKKGAKK